MTVSPNRRRFAKRGRALHRWTGLAVAIVIAYLAVTGIVLNHSSRRERAADRTYAIAVDPRDAAHLLRGSTSGLHRSLDAGRTWREVTMLAPPRDVVDVVFAPDEPAHVYVVSRDLGIVHATDGGHIWESLPLGFVPAAEGIELHGLAAGPAGHLVLLTSSGSRVSDDGGRTWRDAPTIAEPEGDGGLSYLAHQLHTGWILGPWLTWVHDAAAIGTLVLVLTGVVIWRRGGRGPS